MQSVNSIRNNTIFKISMMMIATIAIPAVAQELDQESPSTNTGFNGSASSLMWQQEVTVGKSGKLVQVDIFISSLGTADFFINIGSPWQTDDHDFETIAAPRATGWYPIDVSDANIILNDGDTFVIGIQGRDDGMGFRGSGIPGLYDRGELWLNSRVYVEPGRYDIAFQTWMLPGGGLDCDKIKKFKVKCKKGKLKATIKSSLDGGTELTLDNNGNETVVVTNNKGKAKAKWKKQDGEHTVSIVGCREVGQRVVNCD